MAKQGKLPEYSYPLYRPPSEAKSLILQITEGCSYNRCTFCGMYVDKKFKLKPFNEFKKEVDELPQHIKDKTTRIFLADGDAVIYPTEGLIKILDYLNSEFPSLQSVRSYVGAQALKKKSVNDWGKIFSRKLDLMYFGLESGNNDVLKIMNKGMDAWEIAPIIKDLRELGIRFSVMVILGAGGVKHSFAHAYDSAKWLSDVNPEYLGLLTLFLRRDRNYFKHIQTPKFKHLLRETMALIDNTETKGTILRSNHISNLFVLKGTIAEDKQSLLNQLEQVWYYCEKNNMLDSFPDYYQEML